MSQIVYLVGGPARVGKTTLARRLQQATGVSVISTDAIVWMLQTAVPQLGIRFPILSHNADALQPFVGPFIQSASVWERRSIALEGVAIFPRHVAAIAGWLEGQAEVRAVFLGHLTATTDTIAIGGGWAAEGTHEQRAEWALQTVVTTRTVADECASLGLPYFDVTAGFQQTQDEALRILVGH